MHHHFIGKAAPPFVGHWFWQCVQSTYSVSFPIIEFKLILAKVHIRRHLRETWFCNFHRVARKMFGCLQIWAASRLRLLLNACLMLSSPPKGDKSQVVAHPPTHKRFRARNWSSQIIDMVENRLFWWWSLNVIDGDDKLFQMRPNLGTGTSFVPIWMMVTQ